MNTKTQVTQQVDAKHEGYNEFISSDYNNSRLTNNLTNDPPQKYPELTYKYLDGDTGCGKTAWAKGIKTDAYHMAGCSVMMVVPSIALANETERSTKGKFKAIHSSNRNGEQTVLSEIIERMNQFAKDHKPIAIVICEASFINATIFFEVARVKTDNWVLIKDEPRDPLGITSIKISEDAKKLISKYITQLEALPDSELLCKPKAVNYRKKLSSDELRVLNNVKKPPMDEISILRRYVSAPDLTLDEVMELIENEQASDDDLSLKFDDLNCEITAKLTQFKMHLANPHCEVLIDKKLYEMNILKYSVFQLPSTYSMFEQVFFMKANFTDSFVYHQWQSRGVTWEPINKEFAKMPTNRIKLHYRYSDESRWSAYFRNKEIYQGVTVFDEYIDWARNELKGKSFVYVMNNEYGNEDVNLPGGTRMPAECHGLNSYNTHTSILLAGSYLSSKQDEPFFSHYRTSTADTSAMRQTQFYIQQIARTDIRNYHGTADIHVYVPTINEALSLMVYYKDAELIDENRIGKLNPSFNYQPPLEVVPNNNFAVIGKGVWGEIMVYDVFNPDPEELLLHGMTVEQYVNGNIKNLGHPHLRLIKRIRAYDVSSKGLDKVKDKPAFNAVKEALPWVSAGVYNSGDKLTKANCQGSKFIGFDLDDSDITDAEIAKVMKQYEYLIYTTFSHQANQATRRLRIIVPYNRVVSVSEHFRIKRWFLNRFDQVCNPKGTPYKDRRNIGLDENKSDPWSKLFVPHKESVVKHITSKNKRRTFAIDVDTILAQEPGLPKIQPPKQSDILWTSIVTDNAGADTPDSDANKFKHIMEIINTMRAKDRSSKAVKVGGMMKKLDKRYHEGIFAELENKGVDKNGLKQARKYASGL